MTRNHPDQAVGLKDTGYREERLWSPILNMNMRPAGQGGPKRAKGSKRKIGRNFRFDGGTHPSTKYVAHGGPNRRAARIAHNAQRRILAVNRRHERFLRAAEERDERLG